MALIAHSRGTLSGKIEFDHGELSETGMGSFQGALCQQIVGAFVKVEHKTNQWGPGDAGWIPQWVADLLPEAWREPFTHNFLDFHSSDGHVLSLDFTSSGLLWAIDPEEFCGITLRSSIALSNVPLTYFLEAIRTSTKAFSYLFFDCSSWCASVLSATQAYTPAAAPPQCECFMFSQRALTAESGTPLVYAHVRVMGPSHFALHGSNAVPYVSRAPGPSSKLVGFPVMYNPLPVLPAPHCYPAGAAPATPPWVQGWWPVSSSLLAVNSGWEDFAADQARQLALLSGVMAFGGPVVVTKQELQQNVFDIDAYIKMFCHTSSICLHLSLMQMWKHVLSRFDRLPRPVAAKDEWGKAKARELRPEATPPLQQSPARECEDAELKQMLASQMKEPFMSPARGRRTEDAELTKLMTEHMKQQLEGSSEMFTFTGLADAVSIVMGRSSCHNSSAYMRAWDALAADPFWADRLLKRQRDRKRSIPEASGDAEGPSQKARSSTSA